MDKIIDINPELEYKRIEKLQTDFWTKLVLCYSKGLAERIDREIMADIKLEERDEKGKDKNNK